MQERDEHRQRELELEAQRHVDDDERERDDDREIAPRRICSLKLADTFLTPIEVASNCVRRASCRFVWAPTVSDSVRA